MDSSGTRHLHKSKQKNRRQQPRQPQLFEDTSMQPPMGYGQSTDIYGGYPMQPPNYPPNQHYMPPGTAAYMPPGTAGYMPPPGPPPPSHYSGQQFFSDPMAAAAMQYGTTLADHGKDYVTKNIDKYVPVSKLKYYFAVDNAYVGKKLALLLFPYSHTDWSIKYNQDEPVAPRYEINAPDLYIPVMAFVTYLLVAGIVIGSQDRFTPEQLGMQASSVLVWLIIEVALLVLCLYIMNVKTDLKYLDVLAYCGYKYVGMIVTMAGQLFFQRTGYYIAFAWMSCSLVFFLVRTLKVQILPEHHGGDVTSGNKRRLYLLLVIALLQPLLILWLTSRLYTANPLDVRGTATATAL